MEGITKKDGIERITKKDGMEGITKKIVWRELQKRCYGGNYKKYDMEGI